MIDQTYTPIKLDFTAPNPGPSAAQASKAPIPGDPTSTTPLGVGFFLGAYVVMSPGGGASDVTVEGFDGDPSSGSPLKVYETKFAFTEASQTLGDLFTGEVISFVNGMYLRASATVAVDVAIYPVLASGRILPGT